MTRQYLSFVETDLLFEGAEMRESRSPSYFNPLEMCVVKSYVDQLLGAAEHNVKDRHIGIIAPYHQQVPPLPREHYPIWRGQL